jgi:EAL domain-containing protein (putative c-di-GMP-specific phosphodiesterase class I)
LEFNITAEIVAAYVALLIGISVTVSITKWNNEKKLFISCAFSIALSSILNIFSGVLINKFGIVPIEVNYAVTMLYFIFLFTALLLFDMYFIDVLEKESSRSKKRYFAAALIPYIVCILLVISTPLTGLMFSFGSSGYVRGSLNKATYVFLLYIALLTVFIALRSGNKTTARTKFVILLFPLLSGGVMLIQLFYNNILLTGTAALGPLLLMFMFLGSNLVDVDGDTGLNGHRSFIEAVNKRYQKDMTFSCILIEIDNAKELSDSFGHRKLRKLMTVAAAATTNNIPKIVPGFRYSDNMFSFIFDNKSTAEISSVVSDIVKLFSEEFTFEGVGVKYDISVGAVYCPSQASCYDRLAELLEYAVVQAKSNKDAPVFYCDNETHDRILRRKKIADILKTELASDDNNIEVYYQPIYEISSGRFRTAEALVRLNRTEIGPIYPDEFIPIAEELGLIVRLGEIVLEKTCQFIARLIEEKVDFEAISVNFSVHQIMRDDVVNEVLDMVKKYNIPPEKLRIEITESVIIDNYEHVKRMMDVLGVIGIKFYMDDFGTGYSNLSNMIELPFEYLKVDKSLVRSAVKSEKAYSILTFISQAFVKYNVKILTEGVETKEQEDIVTEIGASYIQGFRFAKPVPGDTAKEYFLGLKNDSLDR